MAHNNIIQIARGNSLNHTTPRYGELFYDKNKEMILIGTPKDFNNVEDCYWKEISGNVRIKEAITKTNWDEIKTKAQKGDFHIITEPGISVTINSPLYNNQEDSNATINSYTYDDYLKVGQVILCLNEDVDISKMPNSFKENNCKWLIINGDREAVDISFFDTILEKAEYFNDDPALGKSVHTALRSLFTKKIHFKIAPTINSATVVTAANDDEALALIYHNDVLGEGEAIWVKDRHQYKKTGTIDIVKIKENYILVKSNGLHRIQLGNKDSSSLAFTFSGARNTTEEIGNINTILNDAPGVISNDADVTNIQQALDDLHQTKADLNKHGKIPLHQIPKTLIGALQYCGTTKMERNDGIVLVSNNDIMTLLSTLKDPESWEENTEGPSSLEAFNELDEGDYFIINDVIISTATNFTPEDDANELKSQGYFVEADNTYRAVYITNGDNKKVLINAGDWIIIRKKDSGKLYFDVINHSAAVDSINNFTGRVTIVGRERDGLMEVAVEQDNIKNILVIRADNTLLAHDDIDESTVIVSAGKKKAKSSSLKVNDTSSQTKLESQSNAIRVTSTMPFVDGTLVTATDSEDKFIPVFDDKGAVHKSQLKWSEDPSPYGNLLSIGSKLSVANENKEGMFLLAESSNSYAFDLEDYSHVSKRKAWEAKKKVLIDSASFIDGGEFDE